MTRLHSIEHFVVLMLENRSFDNLLGVAPKSSSIVMSRSPTRTGPTE
jgi:phospholipase C